MERENAYWITLILCFLLVTLIVHFGISDAVDSAATETLYYGYGQHDPGVFLFITSLGGYFAIVPGTVLVFLYLWYEERLEKASVFAGMMLSSVVLKIFKLILRRPRPDYGVLSLTDYSYPSGHAVVSLVFYVGVYFFIFHKDEIEWFKLFPLLILSFLIGSSRLLLAVHYPTDIIGGFLLGGIVLSVFYLPKFLNKIGIREKFTD